MSSLWGVPDSWAVTIDPQDQAYKAAQTEHLQSLSQQTRVQTEREGIQLQRQKMILQRMAQRTGQQAATAENLTGAMMEAANDEILMGNPDKAARIMSELAQVDNHRAQTKLANEKFNEALYDKEVKRKEGIAEVLAGVNSPEDWQRAQMVILSRYPDADITREMGSQYDPAMVDYLKRVTKTGAEQAKRQYQSDREANVERRHEENLRAARKNLEFRENAINARKRMTEERIERNKKVTGPKVSAPGNPDSNMIRAADAMVRKDFPNLPGDVPLGKDNVSSAAYDIASEAKALMSANRGLSGQEAMHRVYAKMKEAGAFTTETKKGFFSDKRTDSYRMPTSGAKPLPLPPRGTALEDGKIYDKGDGTLFKWDAKRGKGVVIPNGN